MEAFLSELAILWHRSTSTFPTETEGGLATVGVVVRSLPNGTLALGALCGVAAEAADPVASPTT